MSGGHFDYQQWRIREIASKNWSHPYDGWDE